MNPKVYIIDTNVLLSDPECLYAYPKEEIIIPLSVLEEVDRFKREFDERGRNARLIGVILDKIRKEGELTRGIKLKNDAILKVIVEDAAPQGPLRGHLKAPILAIAKELSKKRSVVLVTNNINLRVRASALGLEAISYEERVKGSDEIYQTIQSLDLSPDETKELQTTGFIKETPNNLHANQNLFCELKGEKKLLRYNKEAKSLKSISNPEKGIWGLYPKNLEQRAALDLLMDESVHLVTLAGKAGTGKTLLALAAALELMLKVGSYQKLLVSRPIFPMGRDMGYLPGDIDEKMAPWMQPIFDNLEYLFESQNDKGSYHRLQEKGLIELEPLTYIRGRSIPNRIMIVDESQNLTPHEIKTIVTRVGENTKLILTGDPYQIDNPYIDPNSNGLSYVIQKFQDYSTAGHVTLVGGVRSPLAELASNIL